MSGRSSSRQELSGARRLLTVAGLTVLLSSACRQPISTADLSGSYRLDLTGVDDVLLLRPNGTYVHRFMSANGAETVDSSRWELADQYKERRVVFFNFLMQVSVDVDSTRPRIRGLWSAQIRRSVTGEIRLVVNDDLARYYVQEQNGE